MKAILATFAAFSAIATANAQAFELKQTSDGSTIASTNAWVLHEHKFDIPFGFAFSAGHAVWIGTRANVASFGDAQGVFGYEVYALKDVGKLGDADFFVKASAGACIGPRDSGKAALTGYIGLSAGVRF